MRCPVSLRRLLPVVLLLGAPLLTAAGRSPTLPRHLALRLSEPTDQSRLPVAPERISLWFTARPQLAFSRMTLRGGSASISLDTIVADTGNALHARIPRALTAGVYRVAWQTASADGHPIRGEFTFTVLASALDTLPGIDSSGSTPTDAHAGHDVEQPDHTEYRSARWVEFIAMITILGALGFRHGVLPPLAARGVPTADAADRARRLGQSALVLYGLAATVRLYAESVALNGQPRALAPDALVALLTQTSWGMGWMTGIVGALLLVVGWAISKRGVTMGTPLALTGALGLVASPALTGHAASSDWFIVAVTLDMLHVLAAGVWIGGLFMVLIAGLPAMRRLTDGNPDAAVSALVNSFHPIALFCAPIVVAAGLGTSILRLGGVAPLTTTRYGLTLLVKIGIFMVVAAVAVYNSMRARRQLGTPAGTSRLRRTVALELLLAAAVIAATAFLVTTPAPSLMAQP
jgi:copper transport protein